MTLDKLSKSEEENGIVGDQDGQLTKMDTARLGIAKMDHRAILV